MSGAWAGVACAAATTTAGPGAANALAKFRAFALIGFFLETLGVGVACDLLALAREIFFVRKAA